MTISAGRRWRPAFAAGLATMAMAIGLAALPAEAAPPPRLDYVALGDSYAAGQGTAPYTDPGCYVSRKGYPVIADTIRNVQLTANAACSGYNIQNIAGSMAGRVNSGTEIVTVTVGGNDIGTTNILLACLNDPTSIECAGALGTAQTRLSSGSLANDLAVMVDTIHLHAPNAKVVLTGYPRLFAPGHPYAEVANPIADNLNLVIAGVAAGTESQYVDVATAFADHGIGSAEPWITFNAANILDPANFHPNGDGYRFGYFGSLVKQNAFVLN